MDRLPAYLTSSKPKLDTAYGVETPEGVDLVLTPAGFGPRVLAFLIDFLIRLLVLIVFGVVFSFFGKVGGGLFLVLMFVIEWFYPVFFEVFRQGATPGKRKMGLEVVHDDGTPVSASASLLRNLLRVVDFMPLAYCAGLVVMLMTGRFQRLGDLAAGTLVVYRADLLAPEYTEVAKTGLRTLSAAVAALPAHQQRMLVEFAERAPQLTAARQQELANLLSPVFGLKDQALLEFLHSNARALTGK